MYDAKPIKGDWILWALYRRKKTSGTWAVQDPGLRVFDIIMHSDHGTSYNSYIVKGTEKTVLFETSKEPFFEEFLANIREVCDPASLDYIVVNHTEPDHTGSMKRLLELAPGATVLGSGTALTF